MVDANKSYKNTQVTAHTGDLVALSNAKAMKWFYTAVKSLKKNLPPELEDIRGRKIPPIGELVMYIYDPKLKETLPYYDEHPLIICTSFDASGFNGINLHYIDPAVRRKLVKFLQKEKEKSTSERDYARRVFPLLNKIAGEAVFKHCYKRYLGNHVRSKIAIINPTSWNLVTLLPFQQFRKTTAQAVWADSRRK